MGGGEEFGTPVGSWAVEAFAYRRVDIVAGKGCTVLVEECLCKEENVANWTQSQILMGMWLEID